jgi:adenylyltransferase/sulfurtransferase
MGVGNVRVIDSDIVELSNLHRVRMFREEDVGRPKAAVLASRLTELLRDASIDALVDELSPENALAVLEGSDVVLDGLDDMDARYVVNDACLELAIPWVYGGVVATSGLVSPFLPGGPCLRCLFPEPPMSGSLPSTETHGIHPSLPATVAAVQVSMATRILLGKGVDPVLLAMDLWSGEWRTVSLERREGCKACSQGLREFIRR